MGATFFASFTDHFISAVTSYSSLLSFSSSYSSSPSSSSSMVDVSLDLSFLPTSSSSPHFQTSTHDSACDHDSKRRKSQHKRVVYVPINADSKQKCEAPPSDLWAWRKYGQKPIKGSPYPRGYYKCSSSKGCSARKQVERSRTDPSMLIITYMTEHNHLCSGSSNSAIARPSLSDPCQQEPTIKSKQHLADLEPPEELFPCIIISPTSADPELMDFLETPPQSCSIFPTDEDLCFSRSISEDEDFFHDLGELPELATMFAKGHQDKIAGGNTFSADWSSTKLLLSS